MAAMTFTRPRHWLAPLPARSLRVAAIVAQ